MPRIWTLAALLSAGSAAEQHSGAAATTAAHASSPAPPPSSSAAAAWQPLTSASKGVLVPPDCTGETLRRECVPLWGAPRQWDAWQWEAWCEWTTKPAAAAAAALPSPCHALAAAGGGGGGGARAWVLAASRRRLLGAARKGCPPGEEFMDAIGVCVAGLDHSQWHNRVAQRAVGQRECFCYKCCEKCFGGIDPECDVICPERKNIANYCPGPATGCTGTGAARRGCFGMNLHGETGSCVCGEGQFSKPEKFKVGGVVVGLPQGMTVLLSLEILPLHAKLDYYQTPSAKTVMTKKVKLAGPFEMPFLLPMNHKYSLEVVDTHWQGKPTKKLACAIANGATGSDEYDRDVMNVQVSCQPTQIVNGALGKGTREQRMFHKLGLDTDKRLRAPDCQDSPVFLNMDGDMDYQEEVETAQNTKLPCKRKFTMHPMENSAKKMYVTEMRGHSCVNYNVEADSEVNVCFVPAIVYFNLGPADVVRDKALCTCRGKKCQGHKKALLTNTTYLLWVSAVEKRDWSIKSDQPVHLEMSASPCSNPVTKKIEIAGAVRCAAQRASPRASPPACPPACPPVCPTAHRMPAPDAHTHPYRRASPSKQAPPSQRCSSLSC